MAGPEGHRELALGFPRPRTEEICDRQIWLKREAEFSSSPRWRTSPLEQWIALCMSAEGLRNPLARGFCKLHDRSAIPRILRARLICCGCSQMTQPAWNPPIAFLGKDANWTTHPRVQSHSLRSLPVENSSHFCKKSLTIRINSSGSSIKGKWPLFSNMTNSA